MRDMNKPYLDKINYIRKDKMITGEESGMRIE